MLSVSIINCSFARKTTLVVPGLDGREKRFNDGPAVPTGFEISQRRMRTNRSSSGGTQCARLGVLPSVATNQQISLEPIVQGVA